MRTFKNLEEIWKTWKKFLKTSDNPEQFYFVLAQVLSTQV